ncbi:cation diffusion facilitator family transporter [Salegentibacter sp. F188]|uniref:Cation diffusion facilitator family transporter n=2 Tax=Autumnicola TaxID=3160927 RepID=A0ABU3E7B1_9FLAO|nr:MULTISPECIES: cation diffusion facilitator family transporter [Flavobacteriaceae]MDT0687360.1 cation diffusion facilitator family transporter [Zunongwangia sp. F225]MDT0691802.1 cation diffusion facilitator family transporter [Salegentibacter sp. F188]
MKDQQREKNLKTAKKIQEYNVGYDIIEVGVSLFAGFTSGSSALIGWGLDSVVEVVSASTLWWRLNGELKDIEEERVKKRERITLYVIATSFLLVSIFITYDSVTKFISKEAPDWSTLGIIILLISLVVNPILIWYKYRYGKKLDSQELIADSKDTFVCLYQTVAVLAGLLAVQYLDWWWADPVAALLIVPYALKESWEAFKNGRKISA